MNPKTIVTHSGNFHADDVFSVAVFKSISTLDTPPPSCHPENRGAVLNLNFALDTRLREGEFSRLSIEMCQERNAGKFGTQLLGDQPSCKVVIFAPWGDLVDGYCKTSQTIRKHFNNVTWGIHCCFQVSRSYTIMRHFSNSRFIVLTAIWLSLISWHSAILADAAPSANEQRCGWFDNPSPGNATLRDRDAEWVIGMQGGHQAKGSWPKFTAKHWVKTGNGSAGYGCACMKVSSNADTQEILTIRSARSLPLTTCRKDKALKDFEPENPLASQ